MINQKQDMNENQKKTLMAGGILLLIALAFPPTNKLISYSSVNTVSGGYQLIFDMPYAHKVEYVQWVIPIIAIAAITLFIFNAFKGKNEELH